MNSFLILLLSLTLNAQANLNAQAKNFPDHWWKPVTDLASWEIGPQAGDKGKSAVLSKRNELGILSNFAHTPFELDGVKYQSIEGLWQSMKFPEEVLEGAKDERVKLANWKYTRAEVAQMVAFEAKEAGSYASSIMKANKINWVSYQGKKMIYKTSKKLEHFKIIVKAMKAKLNQNKKVADILRATKGLKLLPDHKTMPTDPPAWKYYQIWMELRDN